MIPFTHNDGGRAAAGLPKFSGDCVTRAISIATGLPYLQVSGLIEQTAAKERPKVGRYGMAERSNPRTGVWKKTYDKVLAELGFTWVPCMSIGSGCRVHLRAAQLPKGRVIVRLSKHVAAVIDGVLNDTYDCSRGGTRCVYGYYIKQGEC